MNTLNTSINCNMVQPSLTSLETSLMDDASHRTVRNGFVTLSKTSNRKPITMELIQAIMDEEGI